MQASVDTVEIFEVGPRDGLQNEPRQIDVAGKVQLVDALSLCGFRRIEVASFVSPKLVPQMADGADVLAAITRAPGVSYAALTPNLIGFANACAARVDEIAVFASASEGFSRANINATIAESIERFQEVTAAARNLGMPVRGYVSCVTDCPYDGPTKPESVASVAAALARLGCYEISLGDTIGQGRPETVAAMFKAVTDQVAVEKLAGHFHDTNGRALDNIEASLDAGVRVFDAAIGGLGGCPFAPGATGNVSTIAVHDWLVQHGHATGLDRDALSAAATIAESLRGDDT